MGLIQRLGLFSILFRIWQNLEKVCQDSSSVILKSKCELRKYNLQSWFIYTQLKSSFISMNFLNLFFNPSDFSRFPPKERWKNKLKTLKMFEGVCFTVLKVDTGKISSLKNIFTSPLKMILSHMYLILQKVMTDIIVVIIIITTVDFCLTCRHSKLYFLLQNIDFCFI